MRDFSGAEALVMGLLTRNGKVINTWLYAGISVLMLIIFTSELLNY